MPSDLFRFGRLHDTRQLAARGGLFRTARNDWRGDARRWSRRRAASPRTCQKARLQESGTAVGGCVPLARVGDLLLLARRERRELGKLVGARANSEIPSRARQFVVRLRDGDVDLWRENAPGVVVVRRHGRRLSDLGSLLVGPLLTVRNFRVAERFVLVKIAVELGQPLLQTGASLQQLFVESRSVSRSRTAHEHTQPCQSEDVPCALSSLSVAPSVESSH